GAAGPAFRRPRACTTLFRSVWTVRRPSGRRSAGGGSPERSCTDPRSPATRLRDQIAARATARSLGLRPGPAMRSAGSELPLLDDQTVPLGELGHRQGRSGQGRVESATEGAVARGDRGTAIAQHPACVLVAQERAPGEAVQRDRVRRLLADPL